MANLSTQTNKVSVVIDFPSAIYVASLVNCLDSWLKNNTKEYWYCVHKSDFDELGSKEVPHIHVLYDVTGFNDRQRLSTHLNILSSALGVNPLLISVDRWFSYEGGIQYLTHKNQIGKTPHKLDEVFTSESDLMKKMIFDREIDDNITINYLISVINEEITLPKIYAKLGLKVVKSYRAIIYDLYSEKMKYRNYLKNQKEEDYPF